MFNLKLTTKVTFSFSKLSHKLEKILSSVESRSGRNVADKLKDYIKSGKVKPALKETTIKRRNQIGYNPHYPGTRGNKASKSTPLYTTGSLYNSIKSVKGGISFNAYGFSHDRGIGRPQRKWLMLLSKTKEGSRILSGSNLKKFREDIKKAFKLPGGGKNIREMKF